jgi:replicative DNA helicase
VEKLRAVGGQADSIGGEGRVPPHDLDAEAAVISSVMLDPLAFDKVNEFLKPEHFYSEAHRRIHEACVELSAEGKPVDVVQVATWLRDRERLAQVGGMAYLTEVLNAAPAVANVVSYAKTIHEKYRVRQLILACQRVSAQGYAGYGEAQQFIDSAEQAVYDIARTRESTSLFPLRDVMQETFRRMTKANARGARITGIATGFATIGSRAACTTES